MTQSRQFFWGSPLACLRLAGVCLLPMLLATCGEDGPGGPSGPPVIGRVEFTSGPIMSGGYFGPNLPIDRVHILIVRPPSQTLRDTTRAFDANLNRLRFDLPVLLSAAAESLDVTLELLSGTTVLFSGTSRLEAQAGPPSTTPPPPIPLIYSGPGSQIAQLVIAPPDSTLGQGDSLIMRVSGLDGSQQPVPAFYVGWSSSDTAVARVNGAGVVRGLAGRGTVFIRARTPNSQLFPAGIVESTTVTLVPDPATLIKVGGDNQTAALGTTLPQMLAVEVRAGDNLPIAGIQVAFATTNPGASVDSATATTDANGVARTHAVLGTTAGPQSFSASVPGTSTVTFSATATAAPTPTWTGAVSFDWDDPGNWNTGSVPGGADSVTIPAGTPNSPDLTGNVSIAALLNNNVLNMANFSLTLDGNLRGSGSISGNSTSSLSVAAPATIIDHAAVTNLVVSGASVALARNMTVSGNLTVQGFAADLDLNGHSVTVSSDFATQGNGTLTMANALDTLRVLDDVLFNGGSTAGRISSGAIIVLGDFTQQATSSGQSYAPTGNHLDVFAGNGVQTITFATPGATSSNFETLGLANSAGGVTLASDVFLAGPVGFATGVPRIAHGSGQTLFVAELLASNATLDNILVAANNVLLTQLDSISFINYSPTATPLTISHPGSATPFVMNDLSFGVTPTSGFYISATDLVADANVFTLNLVNPTPGASGGFVRTQGGAVVNWPFVPAGSRIWTGAVDSDWFKPGNWNPAIVPGPTDDVVIPSTGTAPVLTGGAGVHHLTIQPGATLTSSFDFDVSGDAIVNGSFAGSGIIVMSTHGSSVAGNISNLEIDLATRFESILVSGTLTVNGLIEVQRGHFDLGGHTVTTGNFATISEGMLKMVNPGDGLIVNGNADFGGEDPTGVLTAGTIRLRGNFAQLTGVTQGSFVATGTNRVILDGTGPQFVTFTSPAGNGSRFQDLEIANTSDTVFTGSNVFVSGQLVKQVAGSAVISGAAQLFTASGAAISGLEFINAPVALLTGTVTQFDNITWSGFSPFITQLTVTRPAGTLTFNNHVFATTPSTGFYLRADDTNPSDGQPLTINLVSPTPATPGSFVQIVGGAVVNWPTSPGGTTTWTGAVSTNWQDAGNWSNGVPTATDDVDFTQSFTNSPSINNNAAIRNLAVASGRVITVQTGVTLTIHGDAVIGGTVSGPGTVDMVGTSGNLVAGVFPNLKISAPYTLGGTLEVHGTFLTIQSDLTVGANTIVLFANLSVSGSGRLIMTDPNSLVSVQGFAIFDGASTVGTLTAGLLAVTNNFTQSATTSSNSFTASGSHITVLNGAGLQVVTFANPTVSAFQGFQYGGNGSLSLGSDVRVLGAFTSVVSRVISGSGRKLTTAGISTTNGTFDNVLIEVSTTLGGALLSINNTTFQNYPSTATQLSIVHPGPFFPATFDGLTFSSTPTTGLYISAQDQNPSDGLPLIIDVSNTTPSSGSPFVQTAGGAVVNWPAAGGGGIGWNGSVSSDWFDPANWNGGVVPGSTDDVTIPGNAPNQPVLTNDVTVNTFQTTGGGFIDVDGNDLVVNGDFSGTALSGSPSGFVLMAGTGVSFSGSAPNLQITGSVSANGVVNIQENLSVLGSGAHLRMLTPGIVVVVSGSATFNGGSSAGDMVESSLHILGDLVVGSSSSSTAFAPSGNHVTVLTNGTGPQTITMANEGFGGNHFQHLSLASPGQFNLAQDVFVGGTLNTGGPGAVVQGSASEGLHVRIPLVNGLVMSNARLLIENTVATPIVLDDVTFQQMNLDDDQLTVDLPGGPTAHTFNDIVFTDVPTGGLYLFVADNTADANTLTVTMVNPTPATGSGFIGTTGGAVVNW